MMKVSLLALITAAVLSAPAAHAKCFQFVGAGPGSVGPVKLFSPATRVCDYKVHAFGGRTYYSVHFADSQGDLAQLASQDKAIAKCLCSYSAIYTLTSGNANGANVNPDSTSVTILQQQQNGPAELSIFHPSYGSKKYAIRPE